MGLRNVTLLETWDAIMDGTSSLFPSRGGSFMAFGFGYNKIYPLSPGLGYWELGLFHLEDNSFLPAFRDRVSADGNEIESCARVWFLELTHFIIIQRNSGFIERGRMCRGERVTQMLFSVWFVSYKF